MGYGGVVVAAVLAVLILLVFPHAVDRETAITQSRESDRFSPRMRLLRAGGPTSAARGAIEAHGGGRRSQPLLSAGPPAVHQDHQDPGETMTSQVDPARRPRARARVEGDAQSQTLHEVARLRARRAARLSREQAAGQRRMLASAVLAVATALVVVLAAVSLVGWAWVALPTVSLAAALGLSRSAAVRSEHARQTENSEMHALRENLRAQAPAASAAVRRPRSDASPDVRSSHDESHADSAPVAESAGQMPDSDDERQVGEAGAPSSRAEEIPDTVAAAAESAQVAPAGGAAAADGPHETSIPQRRTWTVPDLPAPSYASRERVGGREIHPDTDIRGIPQVDAAVPARPIAGGEAPRGVRSTEQVVAAQPVAFDLEAVLDARRAE